VLQEKEIERERERESAENVKDIIMLKDQFSIVHIN
jgi:hypothetical protein